MLNFFCKILQHPKINPGSAPEYSRNFGYTQIILMLFGVKWASNMSGHFNIQTFKRLQKVFVYTHFDVVVFVSGLC